VTWWWILPASVAGALPLCLKLSPAGERKLEVVSLLFGAGCLIALMVRAFV